MLEIDGNSIPKVKKAGADIRLVLHTGCQSGCDFCHLEGNKSQQEIGTLNYALTGWRNPNKKDLPFIERLGNAVKTSDVAYAIDIGQAMGLKNIHLTGGEPTLSPELPSIIKQIKDAGLTVSLTTHGEINSYRFGRLLEYGLKSINFSVHALTPEQYLAMDLIAQEQSEHSPDKALAYAKHRLMLKKANIITALMFANQSNGNFKVATNTVVRNPQTALQIIKWLNKVGITPRLQKDLNNKSASQQAILDIIGMLRAYPTLEEIAVGDSSGSGIYYTYNGGEFKVKQFGDIYIPGMCDQCPLKGSTGCRERFYGIRVSSSGISTCIDVQTPGKTMFSFSQFLDSQNPIAYQIKETYRTV